MRLFAVALVIGIALGYLRGGRLRALGRLPSLTLAIALIWVALAIQLASGALASDSRAFDSRFWASAASYGVVGSALAYAWMTLVGRPATRAVAAAVVVVFVGWLANFVVIAANGGMPVSSRALELAGEDPETDVERGDLFKHVSASDDTRLLFLGDVIPVPPLRMVVSAGDIVLAVGIVFLVSAAMALRPSDPDETA